MSQDLQTAKLNVDVKENVLISGDLPTRGVYVSFAAAVCSPSAFIVVIISTILGRPAGCSAHVLLREERLFTRAHVSPGRVTEAPDEVMWQHMARCFVS